MPSQHLGSIMLIMSQNNLFTGEGKNSSGDNFAEKTSPFRVVTKFSPRKFFAQFDSWLTVTVTAGVNGWAQSVIWALLAMRETRPSAHLFLKLVPSLAWKANLGLAPFLVSVELVMFKI